MKVMLLDCETTGLNPAVDRITELGIKITSMDFKTVYAEYNKLIWDDTYPEITPEIEEITGIDQQLLLGQGIRPWLAMQDFNEFIHNHQPKYIIAYNAGFDRQFIDAELQRQGHGVMAGWICAMVDVKANYKFKSWKLMHLALDYGIAVDPSELHRAINDVELMRKVLVASGTTPDDMWQYKQSPSIYLAATTRPPWEDGGDSTTRAKQHGFAWEKSKGDDRMFPKRWVKKVKQMDYKPEEYPFLTTIIGE